MATIQVKEIRVNGKKLRNVNDLPLKNLIYQGNTYELKSTVKLTIYTNNDYDDYRIWNLDSGTYVEVNDIQGYISAGNKKVYAGSKSGYDFKYWDKSSFYIDEDTTIEGIWEKEKVLLGSAEIIFVWNRSNELLVCQNINFEGEVANCSVNVGDYWICLENQGVNFDVDFYNSSGTYIGSETFEFLPISGDPDTMYPPLSFTYYE